MRMEHSWKFVVLSVFACQFTYGSFDYLAVM